VDDANFDTSVPPSGDGCVECLATPDQWWFHLRRCAKCGHVGCCDSSPNQHASKHAFASGHRVAQSFEPGEDWFWDYSADDFVDDAPELAPPHWHPESQTVPGPRERVPPDWQDYLN